MVKKIWHFIGLPDPEEHLERKKLVKTNKINTLGTSEESKTDKKVDPTTQTKLPIKKLEWDGPLTPKGEPFHDLGLKMNSNIKTKPSKALRYVTPDSMNRLPIESMTNRLYQGDVVVVDLSVMVHMEGQQRACRQSLRQLSNERRIPIYSLDDKDNLLMLPGSNIMVDISKYDLI